MSRPRLNPRPLVRPDRHRPFVPTCPFHAPSRAGAVNDGRRPPPQAARSVIDGAEHEGIIPAGGKRNEERQLLTLTLSAPTRGGEGR
jgi:hypothetical protein